MSFGVKCLVKMWGERVGGVDIKWWAIRLISFAPYNT